MPRNNTIPPVVAAASCSELIGWMDDQRICIDRDYFCGVIWWRVYKPDPGGHYMEDRIEVLGRAASLGEALAKAGFPIQNAGQDAAASCGNPSEIDG